MSQMQAAGQDRYMARLDQVRDNFYLDGKSVAEWAREHGLRPPVVYDLLSGRTRGTRGNSHKAAVLLGLKKGAAA